MRKTAEKICRFFIFFAYFLYFRENIVYTINKKRFFERGIKMGKMVKRINGASVKVQIFLWYVEELKNKKCTNFFPDFEQDMTSFNEAGVEKVKRQYENSSMSWSWEKFWDAFEWAATAEASILATENAKAIRDELVAEGFLWKRTNEKTFGRHGTGRKVTTYIGLTEKGKKWAPKYIARYGKAVIEEVK